VCLGVCECVCVTAVTNLFRFSGFVLSGFRLLEVTEIYKEFAPLKMKK
jgi:hypothetical protein